MILLGVTVQVKPVAGDIEDVRATVPVKPVTGANVIVELPATPASIVRLVGETATVKSCTV